jgi:hypothetical protein
MVYQFSGDRSYMNGTRSWLTVDGLYRLVRQGYVHMLCSIVIKHWAASNPLKHRLPTYRYVCWLHRSSQDTLTDQPTPRSLDPAGPAQQVHVVLIIRLSPSLVLDVECSTQLRRWSHWTGPTHPPRRLALVQMPACQHPDRESNTAQPVGRLPDPVWRRPRR